MYQHRLVTLSLAALFLGSCSLMPPSVQTSSNDNSLPIQNAQNISGSSRKIAIPASYTAPQQQNVAKTVSFPNMVKTTEINEPQLTEIQEVESLLKAEGIDIDDLDSLDDGGFSTQSFNSRRLFFAQFKTSVGRRARSYQVKIPANGQFELKLKEGSRYKILDNDATDGTAVIQMPAATLKTWLHLNRNWHNDSELKVEDPLYYVSDTLSSERKKWFSRTRWLSMGLRPLPVPSEWGSPHGNDFVLNMTAKNVKAFSMIWLQKNAEPILPPFGIKEIGPEGGTVKLPGVGEITFEEGSLEEKTIIKLEQIIEAKPPEADIYPELDPFYDQEFVSPVLRVSPKGLKLKKRALIVLPLNKERMGDNTGLAADYKYTQDANALDNWRDMPHKKPLPRLSVFPLDYPSEVYVLGEFAAFIEKGITPTSRTRTIFPSEEFSIQSFDNSTEEQLSQKMAKYDYKPYPCLSEKTITKGLNESLAIAKFQAGINYCNRVFRQYVSLMDSSGKVKGKKSLMPTLFFEPDNVETSKPFFQIDFGFPKNLAIPKRFYKGRTKLTIKNEELLADFSDAIAHETWHAFQYANQRGRYLVSLHGDDEWLIEGSAQTMGSFTSRKFPMPVAPLTKGNAYPSSVYDVFMGEGIEALGDTSLYELPQHYKDKDYRATAFFTYLSKSYGDTPLMLSRLATYFSENSPDSLISGLDKFIEEEKKEKEKKKETPFVSLPEQYVGFSHAAISKEKLDSVYSIKEATFTKTPNDMDTVRMPLFLDKNFTDQNRKMKGLTSKFYQVRAFFGATKIDGPVTMLVKVKSDTPEDFRTTALLYNKADLSKYPRVPTKRMWNSQGIGLFNEKAKTDDGRTLFITSNLNTTYTDIYIAVTNTNFKEDIEKQYDLEIEFQQASNPTGTKPSKQGSIEEQSKQLALTVENSDCLQKNCDIFVESINGNPLKAKLVSVKVTKKDENDNAIEEEMIVEIPSGTKQGGFIYVEQQGIAGAQLDDAAYVCNMLPKESSFGLNSFTTPEKLKPCFAR